MRLQAQSGMLEFPAIRSREGTGTSNSEPANRGAQAQTTPRKRRAAMQFLDRS